MTAGGTTVGVILAGGLSTRMQGPEKTLMPLGGRPMISHINERFSKQVSPVIINANGDPSRFAFLDLPVQPDTVEGFAGPLAGVLAGMQWASNNAPEATHVLTVAGDTPFFPADLAEKLKDGAAAQSSNTVCLAYSDGNRHPTFGCWPVALQGELEAFLLAGDRKVMLFAQRHNLQKVDFPLEMRDKETFDPFFNVNTPDEFKQAENMMAELAK